MIVVPDKDYFYMITLVGFIENHNCSHYMPFRSNGKTVTLKQQCKIVEYFRPSKIAINFVFI